MPGRQYSGGSGYRYGFNGKENDNDVKGIGNQQDYGMRIYDPRLGKFLSVDPISDKYPWLTPYQFASNTPLQAIDIDGLEAGFYAMQAGANYGEAQIALKAASGDPEAINALSTIYDANKKIAVLTITTAATVLTAGRGNFAFKALFRNATLGGITGSVVNAGFSLAKGQKGYDFVKALTSGFFSGAILGAFGTINALEATFTVGATSSGTGELVNQAFDNTFGRGDGSYDLEKVVISAGIGGVANVLSSKIVEYTGALVDRKVATEIANTNTKSFKESITNVIKEGAPGLSGKSLRIEVGKRIKEIQSLIKQQGQLEKVIVKQSIERSIDGIQEAVPKDVEKKTN